MNLKKSDISEVASIPTLSIVESSATLLAREDFAQDIAGSLLRGRGQQPRRLTARHEQRTYVSLIMLNLINKFCTFLARKPVSE